jgi:pimeloyl-ACP methyl ester carboxylesterase
MRDRPVASVSCRYPNLPEPVLRPGKDEIAMKTLLYAYLRAVSIIVILALPSTASASELPEGVKTQRVNGYDMAYLEQGNGRPLVMVHGGISDYRAWRHQMESLGRTNRAIAVSLRHYFPARWQGKGPGFSWEQHVSDLIAFIKALDAGPVDLMGHSRGGVIALEAAFAEPGLIRRLILAEPSLTLNESGSFGLALKESAAERGLAIQRARASRVKSVLNQYEQGDIEGGLEIWVDGLDGAGSWFPGPDRAGPAIA